MEREFHTERREHTHTHKHVRNVHFNTIQYSAVLLDWLFERERVFIIMRSNDFKRPISHRHNIFSSKHLHLLKAKPALRYCLHWILFENLSSRSLQQCKVLFRFYNKEPTFHSSFHEKKKSESASLDCNYLSENWMTIQNKGLINVSCVVRECAHYLRLFDSKAK